MKSRDSRRLTSLVAAGLTGIAVFASSAMAFTTDKGGLARAHSDSSATDAPKSQFKLQLHPAPKPLPDLQFLDRNGRSVALSSFRGKVLLLNLWATSCRPCREEMPALDRLQAKLGGREFHVVPLSIDSKGIAIVKAFYERVSLKALSMYLDASQSATDLLDIVGVPTTVLVDRSGREVGRVTGPAEWDSDETIEIITRFLAPVGA